MYASTLDHFTSLLIDFSRTVFGNEIVWIYTFNALYEKTKFTKIELWINPALKR